MFADCNRWAWVATLKGQHNWLWARFVGGCSVCAREFPSEGESKNQSGDFFFLCTLALGLKDGSLIRLWQMYVRRKREGYERTMGFALGVKAGR